MRYLRVLPVALLVFALALFARSTDSALAVEGYFQVTATITSTNGISELSGNVTIEGDFDNPTPGPLDTVPIEMLELSLTGLSPIGATTVTLRPLLSHPFQPSTGSCVETVNALPTFEEPFVCTFYVFLTITDNPLVLHNDDMLTLITGPISFGQAATLTKDLNANGSVPLLDENDVATGREILDLAGEVTPLSVGGFEKILGFGFNPDEASGSSSGRDYTLPIVAVAVGAAVALTAIGAWYTRRNWLP